MTRIGIARFDLRDHINEAAFAHWQPSAAVYAFVAALPFVGFQAGRERCRPALKLEWVVSRQLSGVLQCLGHTDELNVVPQTIEVAFEPFLNNLAGLDTDIYTNPAPSEILGGMYRRAAAAERVKYNVARFAGRGNYTL